MHISLSFLVYCIHSERYWSILNTQLKESQYSSDTELPIHRCTSEIDVNDQVFECRNLLRDFTCLTDSVCQLNAVRVACVSRSSALGCLEGYIRYFNDTHKQKQERKTKHTTYLSAL